MAWWRHDPSLWARSPAHRYAQRVLRGHEAALRTRCFSRTPSNKAQHQDQDDARRPDGMTDSEWTQLQHYQKWRKRLQEHPYRALFGASEDMLRGKGLTDWEWVYKTFPKWMLKEMDPTEGADQNTGRGMNNHGQRNVDSTRTNPQTTEPFPNERKTREPTFAEPTIKTTHYERDEFGIVSPSDLRRPKESSHVKAVGRPQELTTSGSKDIDSDHPQPTVSYSQVTSLGLKEHGDDEILPSRSSIKTKDPAISAQDVSDRESSFINAFFANEPTVHDRDPGDRKSWRQTALQRRGTSNAVPRPKANSSPIAKAEVSETEVKSAPVRETIVIPSSQALVDNYPYPRSTFAPADRSTGVEPQCSRREVGWSVPEPDTTAQEGKDPSVDPISVRTTSSVLEILPKDDIDFLNAADIRAAMGTRKIVTKSNEDKKLERQKLESGYAMAKPEVLDEVVEAFVVNNHYVRRTHQELERARSSSQPAAQEVESGQKQPQTPTEPVQVESSIDRMRKWIEEGSASLSKHFWQDPVETGAPSEVDIQFAKQMAGLGKSRRAREHISEDLETDLPMCKGLLERLKNDENRVEHAVHLLQSSRKMTPGAEKSKNFRTMRERRLRLTYERTEKHLQLACQTLGSIDAEEIQRATNAFKRRLGIASRVLHKNHTLTRMLTWSAQARLDENNPDRGKSELYSEILTRLATLRDTQLALARLMDHAIQTFNVSLKPADEALSRPVSNHESGVPVDNIGTTSTVPEKRLEKTSVDTAAAAHLSEEVQSQKAAMQGLSDDGYARAPKQTPRKSFEEKNPLAHSLFRPFNLQLDNLGQKTKGEAAADKLKQTYEQKAGDEKLVQEVRSAYEDVYGPITIDHRQVPQGKESTITAAPETEAFQMLKDDPISTTSLITSETTVDREPSETEVTTGAAVSIPGSTSTSVADVDNETVNAIPQAAETSREPPEPPLSTVESASFASSANLAKSRNQDAMTMDLPTHYTILVHDPQSDTLSLTTSTTGPPRDTSPAIPIHQALSVLKAPAKFVPHITSGLEVVSAKRHMLVLRDALDEALSSRGFETVSAQSPADQVPEPFNRYVNPIDGTTRLSPTGYSGVEQSQEQHDRDFEERRRAAAVTAAASSKKTKQQARDEKVPKKKKKGSIGSVVKTAIWASAVCYIVGVTAEVLR